MQAGGSSGRVRVDLSDLGTRVLGRGARRVDREEDDERDEDVRSWTSGDRSDAFPRRLAPVRICARTLVDVPQRLIGGAPRRLAQLRTLESGAQRGKRGVRRVEVLA